MLQKSQRWLDQKNKGARDVPYLEAGAGEQSSGDGVLIEFELSTSALVRLSVYDVRGRLVRTIINEPRVSGKHSLIWNSRDVSGQRLASGFYFVTLEAGEVNLIDKVLIVR